MTHGDSNTIKCPVCKCLILRPLGETPPRDCGIIEQVKRCPHCQGEIRLWGRWTFTVDAERDSRTK